MAAVVVGSLALGACESDRGPRPPVETPTTAPLPDAEVVTSARESILLMVATLERVGAEHARLAAEIGPWLEMHAAHLAVLGGEGGDEDVVGPLPPAKAAAARRRVLAAERRLAADLGDAAGRASSGDLARALASMSAAVHQRVVA